MYISMKLFCFVFKIALTEQEIFLFFSDKTLVGLNCVYLHSAIHVNMSGMAKDHDLVISSTSKDSK